MESSKNDDLPEKDICDGVLRISCGDVTAGFGINYKLWLEKNGMAFGEGFFKILLYVSMSRSMAQAAREMGMSYRSVWGKIKTAENAWGVQLVNTQVGGEMGGGASLTPEARELLRTYNKIKEEMEQMVADLDKKVFGSDRQTF
jgi:molybdate transport system regulatory protein